MAGPASTNHRTRTGSADARLVTVRILVALNLALGAWYLGWRYLYSFNWSSWPVALALILAETYSYLDAWLFGLTMWRLRNRPPPPPPSSSRSVDVYITCYNEPVDLLRGTVRAANRITYPHLTFVLDDGDSPAMRAMAEEERVGYIVRTAESRGYPRHAKAGNVNNALMQTQGEFILILDADQLPSPEILDRTLGYLAEDPRVALVQTPQWFYNVPPSDPLGCQAPLFYGPIMQGKDGWNAAFFCGSNAVVRREALLQLGVQDYVNTLTRRVRLALESADPILRAAERDLGRGEAADRARIALIELDMAVRQARRDLGAGVPIQALTWTFQQCAADVARVLVAEDLARIRAELAEVPGLEADVDAGLGALLDDPGRLQALVHRESSPLAAVGAVRGLLMSVDVDRSDEAHPVMPLATISITEDMATSMRLHGAGWRSIYHHEILARGLAPQDLGSALKQRLRWAQGTLQVLFRENPISAPGLTFAQRLMYLATMWSYLFGPFAAIYLLIPVLYLAVGTLPVIAYSADFFVHLLPYLVVNQLLLVVVAWRLPSWRGQQYSIALFPLWLRALKSAIGNVYFGRPLAFVVTPKTIQRGQPAYSLIKWQLLVMAALILSSTWALGRFALGYTADWFPLAVNLVWVVYDLVMLSVVLGAVRYTVPDDEVSGDLTAADVHGHAQAGSR